jgi:hypothetical protein
MLMKKGKVSGEVKNEEVIMYKKMKRVVMKKMLRYLENMLIMKQCINLSLFSVFVVLCCVSE